MLTVIIKSQFGYILILNAELDEQYLLNNKVENNNNTIWAFALKKKNLLCSNMGVFTGGDEEIISPTFLL